MAYIKIDFQNPGHKIAAQTPIREAYRHRGIDLRFIPVSKSALVFYADSSSKADEEILEGIKLLQSDCTINVIPFNRLPSQIPGEIEPESRTSRDDRDLESLVEEYKTKLGTLQTEIESLKNQYRQELKESGEWQTLAQDEDSRHKEEKAGAERRIKELVHQFHDKSIAYDNLQKEYDTAKIDLTESRREGVGLKSRSAGLEHDLAIALSRAGDLEKRYLTPRTFEDVILQWVQSYESRYVDLARAIHALGESFDPFKSIDQLLQEEVDRQGGTMEVQQDEVLVSWEQTDYHKSMEKPYNDARDCLKLLEEHTAAVDQGKPQESPIEKLSGVPDPVKKNMIQILKDSEVSNKNTIREYDAEREAYESRLSAIKSQLSARESLRKELEEKRTAQEDLLQKISAGSTDKEKEIPLFLIQDEGEEGYSLRITLPISRSLRDSLEEPFRYFGQMMTQIALSKAPIENLEEISDDKTVSYLARFPKDSWTSQNMQGFKDYLINSIKHESQRFPLFKAGYRVSAVCVEMNRQPLESLKEDLDRFGGSWIKISPYIQDKMVELIEAKAGGANAGGLSQKDLLDSLRGDLEVAGKLRGWGCSELESWRVYNALKSLLGTGRIIREHIPGKSKKVLVAYIPAGSKPGVDKNTPDVDKNENPGEHS